MIWVRKHGIAKGIGGGYKESLGKNRKEFQEGKGSKPMGTWSGGVKTKRTVHSRCAKEGNQKQTKKREIGAGRRSR